MAHSFLVIREGLGSAVRLGARSMQRLTNQLRLAREPECLEDPAATARENPRMERTRSETLKLFVDLSGVKGLSAEFFVAAHVCVTTFVKAQ